MEGLIFQIEKFANQWLQFMVGSSLQFSLFLLLIIGLAFLFRKQSAKFLYLLWLIGVMKLFMPPAIELPNFFGTTANPVAPIILALSFSQLTLEAAALPTSALSVKGYLFFLWLIGIFGIGIYWLINNLRFHKKTRADARLQQASDLISKHASLAAKIKFYTGKNIKVPFASGLFEAKIFLPEHVLTWSENERWAVILHEIAHIKRKDVMVMAVQNMLQIIYFFHPLVWLANVQISRYREKACDDFAIQAMKGRAVEYSKYLLNSISKTRDRQLMLSLSNYFCQSKKFLLSRFEYILNRKDQAMNRYSRFQKLVLLFLAILGIAIVFHKPKIVSSNSSIVEYSLPEIFSADEQWLNNQSTNSVVQSKLTEKRIDSFEEANPSIAIGPLFSTPAVQDTKKVSYVAYDKAPQPIGGFAAIQKNLHYPEIARKAGIEGTVVVSVKIDTQGVVSESKIEKSLGENNGCDEAAEAALKAVKWIPAKQKGKAVAAWVSVPVKFRLAKEDKQGLHVPGAKRDGQMSSSGSLLHDVPEKLPYDTPPIPVNGYKQLYDNLTYPEVARKTGVEGTVTIYTKIDKAGKVVDTKLMESIDKTGLDETTVYKIKESVQNPGVIKGWVDVHITTDESGKVVAELDESAKLMVLVEAAIKAINDTKWQPAYLKGEAVDSWVAVPIRFKLSDDHESLVIKKQQQLEESDSIKFVPFDVAPQPIGGFKAIQEKVYYPELAQKAGIEGTVIIYAKIDEKGEVIDTKIAKPLGNSSCNEAAIQAVKSVRWKPALQKDKPVTAWVSVPVKFSLE